MLRNYLVIALRNLWKHRLFSAINILGMAIGMAACLLILLYIRHEISYDRFHADSDRMYRILTIDKALGVSSSLVGITMPPLGPSLVKDFPEVELTARVTGTTRAMLTHEEQQVFADPYRAADSTFFRMFDFKLLRGDPDRVLASPFSIVLTESLARRMFGEIDPVGKVIESQSGYELTVTGIAADVPGNSHLQFEALYSMISFEAAFAQNNPDSPNPPWTQFWGMIAMPTYIRLAEGA
ncbi:cell division protein FtsX, partial [bacterium]|nr:cell division protein FtsX [bacterium]